MHIISYLNNYHIISQQLNISNKEHIIAATEYLKGLSGFVNLKFAGFVNLLKFTGFVNFFKFTGFVNFFKFTGFVNFF